MKISTKKGWLNKYASGTSSAQPTYKSRLQTVTPEKVDATRVVIQNPILENDEKVIAAIMNKYGINRDAAISTINLNKQAAIKAGNTENKIDYNYTDPRSSSYTGNSLIINPNQLKGKGARIVEAGNYGPMVAAGAVAATAPLVAPTVAAMNTSLAGVPGLTLNNLMTAGFAGHGLKSVVTGEVAEPWKKASKTGNPWDYADAASENIMTGLELLPLAGPAYKGALEAGKYLTEETALKNAYKYNPYAFKPNPEAYYRVIGKEGYQDAIQNNIIRPKVGSNHLIEYPTFKKGVPLDNRYASSNVKGLIGDNSIIVESNGNKMVQNRWTASAPDENVFIPRRLLTPNTEGVKFYKQDWLRGYKEVPKSTSSVEGVKNNLVTQLKKELEEKGIIESQKTINFPWKEPIRKGVEPWGYSNDNASLLPITGSKYKDVKGVIIGGKNPSYMSDKEILMKSGEYDFKLRKANDLLIKEGKAPIYTEEMQKIIKDNRPVLNDKNIKDAINHRDKIKYTYADPHVTEQFIKNQRNRYATWDMYLGKPQTQHPLYDISELTKSKKDIVYTIKEDFMNKPQIETRLKSFIGSIERDLPGKKWTKKGDSWIIPDEDKGIFGTMGGFYWKVDKLNNGNYKIIANDVWDIQPFKNRIIGNSDKLSGRLLNKVLKPIQNIEVGKALGIGKPINVKVGFEIDGNTKQIIKTFGLGGAVEAASALQQKKHGGIIEDNRGQWAHPGKVTRINSNNITMEQVPYPVLGIGADGEQRMMYPEEKHIFNQGPVTEYPMMQAKNGGWLNHYASGGTTVLPSNDWLNIIKSAAVIPDDVPAVAPSRKDSQKMLEYLKSVEGTSNVKNGIYYPYKSSEGGADTIGYGHKLQKGEDFSKGLTQQQVEDLLYEDYSKKYINASLAYGQGDFNKLPIDQQNILTDYHFNTKKGLKGFPALTNAIKEYNLPTTTPERKKELSTVIATNFTRKDVLDRNDKFYESYIQPTYNVPLEKIDLTKFPKGFKERQIATQAAIKRNKALGNNTYIDYNNLQEQQNGGWLTKYKNGSVVSTPPAPTPASPTSNKNVVSDENEQEVRNKILARFDEVIKEKEKPYTLPEWVDKKDARAVCIYGVCNVMKDVGIMDKPLQSNTEFQEKAKSLGFGQPMYNIDELKPGDIFQHKQHTNDQGNYYPTHAQVFKGIDPDTGKYKFYDYYAYYNNKKSFTNIPMGIVEYKKEDLQKRLERAQKKDNSGDQAQFYSINYKNPSKKYPYRTDKEYDEYLKETNQGKTFYEPTLEEDASKKRWEWNMGPDNVTKRNELRTNLSTLFNDTKLDEELKQKLNITDQTLQEFKPLVYGIVDQESNFGAPVSRVRRAKYLAEELEHHVDPKGKSNWSYGPASIKLSSISPEIRKQFDINKSNDLYDPKKMYIAALDVLSKSKKYAKSYITPEAHPNLVSLNPNETALYWYNNPYTIINTDAEQAKKKGIPDYKISMDPGTYPNKVLQAAQELKHYTVNSQENPSVLPTASVVTPKKITPSKQKYGGWLNQYSRGGVTWLNEYQNGGQAQPIFVSDLNDPKYLNYQDSLSLYKKTLEIENPKYYTNGNPSWYRWKGNTESVENFIKKNNIIDDRTGKFPGKIQPIKTVNFGEDLIYPIYKKPTQPVLELTPEVEKQQELVKAGLLKPEQVDGQWGPKTQKAWDLYQSKANVSPEWKPNANDLRVDGTKKGTGFLGVLPRPDGGVSSEISIGVEFDGKETEIPTMVPTLSKEEIDYLLKNPTDKKDLFDTPMGKNIIDKAVNHAKLRMSKGLNPFYQEGEKQPTVQPVKKVQDQPEQIKDQITEIPVYTNGRMTGIKYQNNTKKTSTVVPVDEYGNPKKKNGGWLNTYQDGGNTEDDKKMYTPETVTNWTEPQYIAGKTSDGHYGYNNGKIYYDPDSPIENINTPWWVEHEKYHHYQALNNRALPGRREQDLKNQEQEMINKHKLLKLVPKKLLDKGIFKGKNHIPGAEDLMYSNPNSLEGEARLYENYIKLGGNSIFPTPEKKKNGGWLNTYQDGSVVQPKQITDYKEYLKAKQAYDDSLNLYKMDMNNINNLNNFSVINIPGEPNKENILKQVDKNLNPFNFSFIGSFRQDNTPQSYAVAYNQNTKTFKNKNKTGSIYPLHKEPTQPVEYKDVSDEDYKKRNEERERQWMQSHSKQKTEKEQMEEQKLYQENENIKKQQELVKAGLLKPKDVDGIWGTISSDAWDKYINFPQYNKGKHELKKFYHIDTNEGSKVDSAAYLAGLKLLRENGNPTIDLDPKNLEKYRPVGIKSNYTIADNTMHLEPTEERVLLSELAHSKQYVIDKFNDNNPAQQKLFKKYQEIYNTKGPQAAQDFYDDNYYGTPGTNEYNAHTEIQPKLKNQRDRLVNEYLENFPDFNKNKAKYNVPPVYKKGGWLNSYK